jgi:hypothetical protein
MMSNLNNRLNEDDKYLSKSCAQMKRRPYIPITTQQTMDKDLIVGNNHSKATSSTALISLPNSNNNNYPIQNKRKINIDNINNILCLPKNNILIIVGVLGLLFLSLIWMNWAFKNYQKKVHKQFEVANNQLNQMKELAIIKHNNDKQITIPTIEELNKDRINLNIVTSKVSQEYQSVLDQLKTIQQDFQNLKNINSSLSHPAGMGFGSSSSFSSSASSSFPPPSLNFNPMLTTLTTLPKAATTNRNNVNGNGNENGNGSLTITLPTINKVQIKGDDCDDKGNGMCNKFGRNDNNGNNNDMNTMYKKDEEIPIIFNTNTDGDNGGINLKKMKARGLGRGTDNSNNILRLGPAISR